MGWLTRRAESDPFAWSELWQVLEPYGGRITAAGDALVAERARTLPRKTAVRAAGQLRTAYDLLDTPEHARHIRTAPWRGVGELFARRRFERAVDAVVVAGPETVSRVAAEPRALAGYDAGPDLEPYQEAVPSGRLGVRLFHVFYDIARSWSGSLDEKVYALADTAAGWPGLGPYRLLPLDPEVGYVTVDVPDEVTDDPVWAAAADRAQRLVFDALGGAAVRPIELGFVYIYPVPEEFWLSEVESMAPGEVLVAVDPERPGGPIGADDADAMMDAGDNGVALDIRWPALGPGAGAEEIAALLSARVAGVLLVVPLPLTLPMRAGLERLAG